MDTGPNMLSSAPYVHKFPQLSGSRSRRSSQSLKTSTPQFPVLNKPSVKSYRSHNPTRPRKSVTPTYRHSTTKVSSNVIAKPHKIPNLYFVHQVKETPSVSTVTPIKISAPPPSTSVEIPTTIGRVDKSTFTKLLFFYENMQTEYDCAYRAHQLSLFDLRNKIRELEWWFMRVIGPEESVDEARTKLKGYTVYCDRNLRCYLRPLTLHQVKCIKALYK